MESEEYKQGQAAYLLRRPVTSNPYAAYSKPRLEWDRGWRKAYSEEVRFKPNLSVIEVTDDTDGDLV